MSDDIITGVDKLMSIMQESKKISVQAVVTQLGVPKSLVLEWANMLEEEGSIEIKEHLLRTDLILKEMPKRHDVNYKQIMKPASMQKIKTFEHKFVEFKHQMTSLIGQMEKELHELKKIEMQSQDITRKGFLEVDKKIANETKVLGEFQKELAQDENKINTELTEIRELKKGEGQIEKKLDVIEKKIVAPEIPRESLMRQMELYREKIRNLNYRRSMALSAKQDTKVFENEIEKYKKAYYDIAKKLA